MHVWKPCDDNFRGVLGVDIMVLQTAPTRAVFAVPVAKIGSQKKRNTIISSKRFDRETPGDLQASLRDLHDEMERKVVECKDSDEAAKVATEQAQRAVEQREDWHRVRALNQQSQQGKALPVLSLVWKLTLP